MDEQYCGFAGIYDVLMGGADYAGWVSYIEKMFEHFGLKPSLLLDLGCGTGSAAALFKSCGYDVIGIDKSPEMLAAARQKDPDILFLNQDMRSFELYGTVDCIVSLCDCMNYIMTKKELSSVFRLVENYLNPGGLFIFDINTLYKYKHVLADNTFADAPEGGAYIWNNRYYEKERINEYCVTFFAETSDGLYRRFCETHYQRAYSIKSITGLLEGAGLSVLGVFGEKTFSKPLRNARRVFFAAQRKGF